MTRAPLASRILVNTDLLLHFSMNSIERDYIQTVVDGIGETLVWSWRYYFTLEGIRKGTNAISVTPLPLGVVLNCVWIGLYEALLAKSSQLVDKTKSVHSFYLLFKKIRKYESGNTALLKALSDNKKKLADSIPSRIVMWRQNRLSHLTQSGRDAEFFEANKLTLREMSVFLTTSEQILNRY